MPEHRDNQALDSGQAHAGVRFFHFDLSVGGFDTSTGGRPADSRNVELRVIGGAPVATASREARP